MPKKFWPEAVNWAVYIQNRCPTIAIKNITPEEAWSEIKPSVHFFRIFGCVAHVHVPENQRKKLDNRSIKCVLLGVSEESKAYRLFDPLSNRILVSRDVVFKEEEKWDWNEKSKEKCSEPLDLSDKGEGSGNHAVDANNRDNGNAITNENAETQPRESSSAETVESEPEEEETGQGQKRNKKKPAWLDDYEELASDDELLNLAIFAPSEDPTTYEEAAKHSKWRRAMELELEAIEKNETWELVPLPSGAKKIGVKWLFKTKYNEKGEIEKHKARLVAKGYSQQYGVDFKEVFAPVARWDTIRTIIALAALKGWELFQLDVKSAFLHGKLDETVYVEQPQGYEKKGMEDRVCKLKKALYGLRQAPRAWYSRIESYFQREGFNKCPSEYTLFIKTGMTGEILIVSLYVDDLIFTGNNKAMFEEFKRSMKKEFDMSDLGKMSYFLGVEVIQSAEGIFIGQSKYTKEVLERFGMERSNPVLNPVVPGCKLSKEGEGAEVDPTNFKQIVGSLMYLTVTRPDIMYGVSLISRFMERPTELHMQAAKRVMRYLRGTTEFGVFYSRKGREDLIAYTDSDYARDINDRKSTSGYVFLLGNGSVSWASKKQPVVSLSTTEAEFIAAAMCACQGIWLKRILQKLGHEQDECLIILCDNSSTIKLSKNPVMHGRSKHIDVRFHFLRDLARDGSVKLLHCSSEVQVADIMTKPLKAESFTRLRKDLGVCSFRN